MAINTSIAIYDPNFDFFSRPITVTPTVSQPGQPAYSGRGILDTRGTVIMTDAGAAVLSDQETILDIIEDEFSVVPAQGDIIEVPPDGSITYGVGTYEVTDAAWNGGGEVTLTIRIVKPPTSIGPP